MENCWIIQRPIVRLRRRYFGAGFIGYWGHRYAPLRVAQCVFDTLTILLLYEIAQICFGDLTALLAAGIYAVWPTALQYSSMLGSESIYTFLLCWFVLATLRFAAHPTWLRAAGAGVPLGLALLTRGNAVMMVALLIPWGMVQFRKTPRLIVRACAMPLMALLLLLPWTIRNYLVLHAFIPIQTAGGDVALGSYNRVTANDPLYYGYWVFPTSFLPEYAARRSLRQTMKCSAIASKCDWPKNGCWSVTRNGADVLSGLAPAPLVDAAFSRHEVRLFIAWECLASWGPVLVLLVIRFVPTAIYFLPEEPSWMDCFA